MDVLVCFLWLEPSRVVSTYSSDPRWAGRVDDDGDAEDGAERDGSVRPDKVWEDEKERNRVYRGWLFVV